MKVKNECKGGRLPVAEEIIAGNVYRQLTPRSCRGDLYLASDDERLIDVRTGEVWSVDGFGGDDFQDVTDYVFLDTTNLSPLEN
jgi:hypothetical protein